MKKGNKLARAFAAADEELFAAAENTAFAPSADFERRANAIVRKKNGVTWRFVNTTGKKVAAAALALLLVAAAVFAIPAVRGQFDKNSVTEDENVLYRSEDGKFTIRKVEPLENPNYSVFEWVPVDDRMMHGATDVFVGTITDVTEIYFDLGHGPDDLYIEGIGYLNDFSRYRSLITAEVKDTINGDLTAGNTVTFVFEISTYRAERCFEFREITAEKGKEYVFYLSKVSELENGFYFAPVADYIYHLPAPCMVPYDEPQYLSLLATIGAEEDACGEEFIEALKKYYE